MYKYVYMYIWISIYLYKYRYMYMCTFPKLEHKQPTPKVEGQDPLNGTYLAVLHGYNTTSLPLPSHNRKVLRKVVGLLVVHMQSDFRKQILSQSQLSSAESFTYKLLSFYSSTFDMSFLFSHSQIWWFLLVLVSSCIICTSIHMPERCKLCACHIHIPSSTVCKFFESITNRIKKTSWLKISLIACWKHVQDFHRSFLILLGMGVFHTTSLIGWVLSRWLFRFLDFCFTVTTQVSLKSENASEDGKPVWCVCCSRSK